jgi:hypothetical protein
MLGEARKLGLKVDHRVLTLHFSCDGVQHDEVKSGFGLVTHLTGGLLTWRRAERRISGPNTTLHLSVYERFACEEVLQFDARQPYRPRTLRAHARLTRYYDAAEQHSPEALGYLDTSKPTPTREQPTHTTG